MDLLFPISARISSATWTMVSNSAAARSVFTGAVRTLDRTGDRWRVAVTTENANSNREDYPVRAALKAFRANARGQTNRIWFCDTSYNPRGSFPSIELLNNNTFKDGTSGWTKGPAYTLSASDRLLRSTRNAVTGNENILISSSFSIVQYAPYVLRAMVVQGRGGYPSGFTLNDSPFFGSTSVGFGLKTQSFVPAATTDLFALCDAEVSGLMAGDFVSVPFVSYSRCALVDNGINLLLYSDSPSNSAWTKVKCTASGANVCPDGSASANAIVEDSSLGQHHITQSIAVPSSAEDIFICCALKAFGRTKAALQIIELTGSTSAIAYYDLSGGSASTSSVGANWSNQRSSITSLGNGWYLCAFVARKTNAATSISCRINMDDGSLTSTYTGNGASAVLAWRVTAGVSSVPSRLSQTAGSISAGSLQTGSSLYIKGLPSSANGLLLQGDRVQVGTQLNEVVAPLNSDSAGLGYLQCAVPWRTPPSDNDPVIINQPMGRFILTSPEGGWDDRPGIFSTFSFEMEEALDQ